MEADKGKAPPDIKLKNYIKKHQSIVTKWRRIYLLRVGALPGGGEVGGGGGVRVVAAVDRCPLTGS